MKTKNKLIAVTMMTVIGIGGFIVGCTSSSNNKVSADSNSKLKYVASNDNVTIYEYTDPDTNGRYLIACGNDKIPVSAVQNEK